MISVGLGVFVYVISHYFLLVFLSGACVRAEAATDLTAFEDLGFFKSLDAFEATFFEVFSFLAILPP
jgi:hypothetical protein